jgi:hypothetical protein
MLDRRAAIATGDKAKPYGHERWSAEPVTRRTPPSSQPRHLRGALTALKGQWEGSSWGRGQARI